jgi:hypothetical protein
MDKIEITKLDVINTLIIKRSKGCRFFYSTNDSLMISIPSLASLLKFLVMNEFISHKVLEGILEEFYSNN